MSSLDRVMLYVGLVVLPPVGIKTGLWWSERGCETDPEVTDCDLGAAYAFLGGMLGLAACVAVVVLIELAAASALRRS